MDRPIIFSAPMVRALLGGRKTQTRRVLKPQPDPGQFFGHITYVEAQNLLICRSATGMRQDIRIPYAPGDRLYVREAHAFGPLDPPPVIYRATAEDDGWEVGPDARWSSPIHMPRWASRITLTVTEIRVQRLQEISTDDAIAEGIDLPPVPGGTLALMAQGIAKDAYRGLWNSLHGPDAWDANPWVVAVSFTVRKGNIDAI